jgi:hypothetical protein
MSKKLSIDEQIKKHQDRVKLLEAKKTYDRIKADLSKKK